MAAGTRSALVRTDLGTTLASVVQVQKAKPETQEKVSTDRGGGKIDIVCCAKVKANASEVTLDSGCRWRLSKIGLKTLKRSNVLRGENRVGSRSRPEEVESTYLNSKSLRLN